MTTTVALALKEAVLLIHAQLSYIAQSNGIRALLIKGPGAVALDLRTPRQSTDADIWVDPDRAEDLISLMENRGWRKRPTDPLAAPFQSHATTLYHNNWPCDIDVHRSIPGMEAEPITCFDIYWQARTIVKMANISVHIPSQNGSVIVLALNSLRDLDCARSVHEYQTLLTKEIENPHDLFLMAQATHSLAALKPFLQAKVPDVKRLDWPQPSLHWLFLSSGHSDAQRRLSLFLQTPLRKKPTALMRALFPSKNTFLIRNIYQDTSFSGLLKAQINRYKRGISVILAFNRNRPFVGQTSVRDSTESHTKVLNDGLNSQYAIRRQRDDRQRESRDYMPRKTAVVVVTFNSAQDITACLESLKHESIDHIVVVDNNSQPDQALMVAAVCAQYENVSFHQRPTNEGFGAGVNYGVSRLQETYSPEDYLWVLNPDAIVTRGAVEELSSAIEQSPYDIVSPLITTGDSDKGSSVWFAGGELNSKSLRVSHTSIHENRSTVDEIHECTFITGAAMFMNLGTWNRLSGFTADYFLYWEDADLSYRATLAGLRMAVIPRAVVWHHVGGSGDRTGQSNLFFYYMMQNRIRFAKRHNLQKSLFTAAGMAESARLTMRPLKQNRGRITKFLWGVRGALSGIGPLTR